MTLDDLRDRIARAMCPRAFAGMGDEFEARWQAKVLARADRVVEEVKRYAAEARKEVGR